MSQIEAYPLSWPVGVPRTMARHHSKFMSSFGRDRDLLFAEVKRLGGTGVILSTNIPLRIDGMPYANFRQPDDPGVAIYFKYKGKQMVFACDRWKHVSENLRALTKTIEAIRGIERWGASDMVERAFSGFQALPSPGKEWWEVLNIDPGAGRMAALNARNRLAKIYHPDSGTNPNTQKMAAVNEAYQKAMSALS